MNKCPKCIWLKNDPPGTNLKPRVIGKGIVYDCPVCEDQIATVINNEVKNMKYELEYNGQTYPVKFKHERRLDAEENVLPNGGLTIAYIKLAEDDYLKADTKCSLSDTFCKARGRAIALGRLKQRIYLMENPKAKKEHDARQAQLDLERIKENAERKRILKLIDWW